MSLEHLNKCEVVIQGLEPGILLHNPAGQLGIKGPRKQIPTPEEEAVLGCYWTEDKSSLAFPAWNILRGLIRASSGFKTPLDRKKSLGPIIAGDVNVGPEMVPFNTKDYEIDVRRAIVQRQGILRARPRLRNWQLTFIVSWESQFLGTDFHELILPELLTVLGKSVGIGDFRPVCKGPFGRFAVVSITKI